MQPLQHDKESAGRQQAVRDLTRAMTDTADNLPALRAIFPDTLAPVVQNANAGGRELTMMRWGHARSATIRRLADHQYPQRREPEL